MILLSKNSLDREAFGKNARLICEDKFSNQETLLKTANLFRKSIDVKRFNSLYFGSLSIRHVIYLIFSIIGNPFSSQSKELKNKLHNRISKTFSTKNCFTYSSAEALLQIF